MYDAQFARFINGMYVHDDVEAYVVSPKAASGKQPGDSAMGREFPTMLPLGSDPYHGTHGVAQQII
ncbi:hypothetical protein K474DRAFT_1668624, partial [Panus rudis PR-1116 ss-1]